MGCAASCSAVPEPPPAEAVAKYAPAEEQQKQQEDAAGHAEFVDTHALRELLTCGDLVLVKASYLMELAANGTPLPRRQDLPEHGTCDAQMVERALGELDALLTIPDWQRLELAHFQGIVVISYAWASPQHPDPGCHLLREVLAPALEWYLSERAGYLRRGGLPEVKTQGWSKGRSLGTLEDVDCCVFLDYPSMYQKPRDAAQNEKFYRALHRMELLYSHQGTVKLRSTRHLSSMRGCKPYEDRGWPFFETCVSGLISGTYGVLDLGLHDWTQPVRYPVRRADKLMEVVDTGEYLEAKFDGTLKFVDELARQATYKDRWTSGVAGPLMMGRAVPQVPERFAAGLQTKTFTNQADARAVIELHQRVCQRVLSNVAKLGFSDFGWSEEHVPAIGELCSSCPRLEWISFSRNAFGPGGSAALAKALADLKSLNWLCLASCGAGDEGVAAFCDLAAAGKFARLKWLHFHFCKVGDAGFRALVGLLELRPDVQSPLWQINPDGDGKSAYSEAIDRWATEEGYVPQPACPDAPHVVLAQLGGEAERPALVLEHAAALKRGEPAPLTLSSHPGRAIVPLHPAPKAAGEIWSVVGLGVGPADRAVVAELRGEFLARVSDERVLDICSWHHASGMRLSLIRHVSEHPQKTRHRDPSGGPGGRSFAINEYGNLASLKEPSLVLGVAEALTPAGVAPAPQP